jgi:hypothetical protein
MAKGGKRKGAGRPKGSTTRPQIRDYFTKKEIAEEFAQIRQKDIDEEGKLKIVPKEEIKEALGRSPDKGDTLIMRM